ncbi:MAG: SRPBCC family protein [Sphingomonadaceae bacterium]
MTITRFLSTAFAAMVACAAIPAQAKLQQQSDHGFVVRHLVSVPASPEEAWERVLHPEDWWSGEHSYSGDAANFTLDARAGGCFCEMLPKQGEGIEAGLRGSVEHMRVVYIEKPRALRMSGGLGPLQAEALTGTLTIFLRPSEVGTQILFEYVVGGYFRMPVEKIAPAVDAVLGQQVASLGAGLGARAGSADDAPAPGTVESGEPSEFDREMEAIKDGDAPEAEKAGVAEEDAEPATEPAKEAPFIGR